MSTESNYKGSRRAFIATTATGLAAVATGAANAKPDESTPVNLPLDAESQALLRHAGELGASSRTRSNR